MTHRNPWDRAIAINRNNFKGFTYLNSKTYILCKTINYCKINESDTMVKLKIKPSETTMSLKGQIVILKEIRKRLNLKPNQRFKEYIKDDKIILEPVIPLTELGGSLKNMAKGKTKKQIIKEIKSGWK